jgi:hypothetical protein
MQSPKLTTSERPISCLIVFAAILGLSVVPLVQAMIVDPRSLPRSSFWGTRLDIRLDEQLATSPTSSHPSNAVLVISIADDKSFSLKDFWGLTLGRISGFTTHIEINGRATPRQAEWRGGSVAARTEPIDYVALALARPIPASDVDVLLSARGIALSVLASLTLGIAIAVMSFMMIRVAKARRRRLVERRVSRRLCPSCGYPLLANPKLATGIICAECGWKASSLR